MESSLGPLEGPLSTGPPLPSSSAGPQLPPVGGGSSADPAASFVKLTRGHSCILCQQRKVRCDKNKPCANCVKAGVECVVVPPQPPRRRKNKPHERERDLLDRLLRYEALLIQHGVRLDNLPAADLDATARKPSTAKTLDDLQQGLVGLKTSPSLEKQDGAGEPGQASDRAKWSSYNDYRSNDDNQQDSSDDEIDGSAIHRAFDGMFEHDDGFPFVVGGRAGRITEYHPPGIQVFQLWHIYLTNVNPLLKITHAPTLQAQIIEASANIARIPPPLEALMFTLYFSAVVSMREEDVQSTFDEDKRSLLARYHRASEQALINAGFMRSPDLVVLQAYVHYLLCVSEYVDPRMLFCMIGVAVRIAQRLGLHRDGSQFGMPPFEVELRRRLWWQLVLFDKRIAEMTGSTFTAYATSNPDTQFPLDINDADLHPHAKKAPVASSVGPTEMLFCLTRIEMGAAGKPAAREGSNRNSGGGGGPSSSASSPPNQPQTSSASSFVSAQYTSPTTPTSAPVPTSAPAVAPAPTSGNIPTTGTGHRKQPYHFPPSPNVPDIVTHVANQTLPDDTDRFCARIEATYLRACDPKIPLHLFTILMARQVLCKLRVIRFLARSGRGPGSGGHDNGGSGFGGFAPGGPPVDPNGHNNNDGDDDDENDDASAERDAAFVDAVCMVEYDNMLQGSEILHGFTWYTVLHFPLPAYMLLVPELLRRSNSSRHTGSGALADRAWAALAEHHERRQLVRNPHNPAHVGFGAALVKAWHAHAAAPVRQQPGRALPTPAFILYLQQRLDRGGWGGGSAGGGGGGGGGGGAYGGQQPPPVQDWVRENANNAEEEQPQVQAQAQYHQHLQPPHGDSPAVYRQPSYQQQQQQEQQQHPPPVHPPYFDGTQMGVPSAQQFPPPIPQPMLSVGLTGGMDMGSLDWGYYVPPPQSAYGYTSSRHDLGGGEEGGDQGGEGTGPETGGFGDGYRGLV